MKQAKNILAAAALLAQPIAFTSCEDILGHWDSPAAAAEESAAGIKYYSYDDDGNKTEAVTPSDAIVWTGTVAPGDLAAGTYVVEGNAVCSGILTLKGVVKLILKDGAKLTVDRISYHTGGILNIYGQSDDEATMGQLVCNNNLHADGLNIYGGNITVSDGDTNGAVFSFSTDMTIYAGILRATSASWAGILVNPSKTLTINGGTVIARSSASYCRAGISAGTVVINGGTVEAYGSDNPNDVSDHEGQGAPGILYKTGFDYKGGSLTVICGAQYASATEASRAIATETLGANPIYEAGSLHNTSAAAVTVKTSTDRTTWSGTQNIAAGATQALDFKGIKIE